MTRKTLLFWTAVGMALPLGAFERADYLRESGIQMELREARIAHVQEVRTDEAQAGKDFIDSAGRRVRVDTALTRGSDGQSYAITWLNSREGRTDSASLSWVFNGTLPTDLSGLPVMTDQMLFAEPPAIYPTSIFFEASNQRDRVESLLGNGSISQRLDGQFILLYQYAFTRLYADGQLNMTDGWSRFFGDPNLPVYANQLEYIMSDPPNAIVSQTYRTLNGNGSLQSENLAVAPVVTSVESASLWAREDTRVYPTQGSQGTYVSSRILLDAEGNVLSRTVVPEKANLEMRWTHSAWGGRDIDVIIPGSQGGQFFQNGTIDPVFPPAF